MQQLLPSRRGFLPRLATCRCGGIGIVSREEVLEEVIAMAIALAMQRQMQMLPIAWMRLVQLWERLMGPKEVTRGTREARASPGQVDLCLFSAGLLWHSPLLRGTAG